MPTTSPKIPLPPPLTSDIPGTWAYDTMSRRVRTDILARIFRENTLTPSTVEKLKSLDKELEHAETSPLAFLKSDGGPDIHVWNEEILRPFVTEHLTWLSAPWAVAEFYLYRRIMTAIDYFKNPMDPFVLQKELGLTSAVESINTLAIRVSNVYASSDGIDEEERLRQFQTIVLTSLWGNRMDLSIWPVGGSETTSAKTESSNDRASEAFSSILEAGQKMILSNNIDKLTDYVKSIGQAHRIDIIVDNAGFELFCDLCLADFLIYAGLASCVHIQLKAHPTFVSDAMAKDVNYTIEFLQKNRDENGSPTAQSELGERWASHVKGGKWILTEHFFWVQPSAMWEMPDELRKDLSSSALVFVKGDANYRRLLGDRSWDFDTAFEDILSYFPAPVCALRTLKAELGCGIPHEESEKAAAEDAKWLVAGKYGVVQFCDTRFM